MKQPDSNTTYPKGTAFRVTGKDDGADVGDTVYLNLDDGTDCPYFSSSKDGSTQDYCLYWANVELAEACTSRRLTVLISQLEAEVKVTNDRAKDRASEAKALRAEAKTLKAAVAALKGVEA